MPQLRIAGLVAVLTLAFAGSASASSLSITLTPSGAATVSGSASASSYLWVYAHAAGTPCGATPQAELLANDRAAISGASIAPGPFSQSATVNIEGVGRSVACGYLTAPSNDPKAPGPMYATPDAAAVSNAVDANPCTSTSFAIESVVVAPKAEGPNYYAHAKLNVHADGGGGVGLTDAETGQRVYGGQEVPSGGGTVTFEVDALHIAASDKGKSKTQTFLVDFEPVSGNRCTRPDGTIDSNHVATQQKVSITFEYKGGGSSDAGGGGSKDSGGGDTTSGGGAGSGDDAGSGDGIPTGVPTQSLAKVLAKGSLSAGTVTYSQPGVLTADLLVGSKKAGEIIKVAAKGKPIALKFKLSSSARSALKKAKGAKLTARLTFAPASGAKKQITTKKLSLKG